MATACADVDCLKADYHFMWGIFRLVLAAVAPPVGARATVGGGTIAPKYFSLTELILRATLCR